MKEKNLLSLRNITMAAGLIAVLLLAACGDDDSGSASSPEKIEVVSSIYNLGDCSKSNEGDTVFVKDKKMDYICESGDWKPSEDAGSSDESRSGEGSIKDKSISGVSQKGPFVKGSTVTAYELDGSKSLLQTGRTFSGSISQDDGRFNLSNVTLKSSYVRLSANGYYRNEVTGKNSNAPITLNAVTDLSSRNTVNVNLLTHLEYERVAKLMGAGDGTLKIKDAKKQAEKEIFEAFHIDATGFGFSEDLDVFGNTEADAALLAISIMLQGDRSESELTELLTDLSTDLSDGKWDDSVTRMEIADSVLSKELKGNFYDYRKNVGDWGLSTAVPNFEKYVRMFGAEEKLGLCTSEKEGKIENISLSARNFVITCSQENWVWSIEGELVDNRDGKKYRTVKIGNQTWMAENLAYDDSTYSKLGKIACLADADSCKWSGRYYAWAAALDSAGIYSTNGKGCGDLTTCSPTYPVRGICPEGWHLPDATEFKQLDSATGSSYAVQAMGNSRWGAAFDAYGSSVLPVGCNARTKDGKLYDVLGQGSCAWSYGSNYIAVYGNYAKEDGKAALLNPLSKDFSDELNGEEDGLIGTEDQIVASIRCIKD